MKRYAIIASLALFVSLVSSAGAFASIIGEQTTDLLYAPIPTVMPYGDWEYGIRATLGSNLQKGRFFDNALLIAPARHLEVGASWNLNRPIGPFQWGAKYEILDNQRDHDFVSLAVGVGNITGIQRGPLASAFKANPYVVISRDFGDKLTGYAGYIRQNRNANAWYGGANWQWNDRLQVRAEYIHENLKNAGNNKNNNLISGGLRYEWIKHVDLSPFVSRDQSNKDTVYGLDFQLHGDLRDLTTDDNEDPNRITY